jgi:hypothetical protein
MDEEFLKRRILKKIEGQCGDYIYWIGEDGNDYISTVLLKAYDFDFARLMKLGFMALRPDGIAISNKGILRAIEIMRVDGFKSSIIKTVNDANKLLKAKKL